MRATNGRPYIKKLTRKNFISLLNLSAYCGKLKLYIGKRLRVGKYRVIFRFTSDNQIEIVYIIDIGARGDIYK